MIDQPLSSASSDPVPAFKAPGLGDEVVFIVDDDHDVATAIDRFLKHVGFTTAVFSEPEAALVAMSEWAPRMLLTDFEMPGMNGLELGEKAQEVDPEIPIVVMTGVGTEATAQATLRLGAVDYLTKPVDMDELVRVVQRSLLSRAQEEYSRSMKGWLQEAVERQTRTIRDVSLGALASLVNALEARSPHFQGHSRRVAASAAGIARALDLPVTEVQAIRTAGLLHDLGMIAVPDAVLLKAGPLLPGEWAVVRDHCRLGVQILEPMKHLGPALLYVAEHHERIDGSGYPDGKVGDEISLGGQIVGLADSLVALTEERTFRDPMAEDEALETIEGVASLLFSATLIEAARRSRAK